MPADLVTRLLLQNKDFDRRIKESAQQVQNFHKRIDAIFKFHTVQLKERKQT